MTKRQQVIDLIISIIDGAADNTAAVSAEMIVDRLNDDGFLVLGYGDPDIDRIVETFSRVFHTTKTTKQDRFAASRLAKKFGAQTVVGIITLLAANSGEKYCPVVNSVLQLEDKWPSVLHFLRNIKKDEVIEI